MLLWGEWRSYCARVADSPVHLLDAARNGEARSAPDIQGKIWYNLIVRTTSEQDTKRSEKCCDTGPGILTTVLREGLELAWDEAIYESVCLNDGPCRAS
jgi:hypothetical protein